MLLNKNYIVRLEGLPGSDSIVFKLICSVSKRTKGRDKSYELVSDDKKRLADLVIESVADVNNDDGYGGIYKIRLNRQKADQSNDAVKLFRKPLIATRVLDALDHFVDNFSESLCGEIRDSETKYGSYSVADEEEVVTPTAVAGAVNFELTEQEASELAIVHDESLTNPSNSDVASLEDARTAQITPIRVMGTKVSSCDTSVKNEEIKNLEEVITPKVLVVDDSPSVRKQLELELGLFIAEADYAATANEAFEMLQKLNYDVAFLDVVLPDKDGFSICRHIKETSKETSVIMLTGKAKQADKVKGALAGCDAYIVKPVGRMTFQSIVKNYLRLIDKNTVMEA